MGTQYCLFIRGEPIKGWQVQQQDNFPKKIMLWGMINSEGGCLVVVCPNTINKEEYARNLKRGVVPWINRSLESDYVFMQDGEGLLIRQGNRVY